VACTTGVPTLHSSTAACVSRKSVTRLRPARS
jgi:hypothetical protein